MGETMLFVRTAIKISLVLLMVAHTPLSHAHHSFAATFTDNMITVEGVVERYKFVNPHVMVYFNVVDENGLKTQWVTEGLSATTMLRRGWKRDSITVGDTIRVTGSSTRNGSPMVSTDSLEFIDPLTGTVIGSPGEEAAQSTATSTTPMQRDDGHPNLSGAWRRIIPGRPDDPTGAFFNEAGALLQAAFDPVNDPQVQCEPPGLVRQAAATPHPMKLTQYDDHVVLEYEEYGSVRTVYFDDRAVKNEAQGDSSQGDSLSHLGQSVARYEEQKLIIQTSGLLANLSGTNGNALSDQASTVETYYRNIDDKDGSSITMEMVITDPGHLTAPWTLNWQKYFVEGHQFIENDCEVPLG